jgi:zinc transport system substrate-binding protein
MPDVVVSIKPLHSLVARIMDGVGTPDLLVSGGASLHSFSLKPSQAAALQEAELVVWVGPGLESFLHEPLETLSGKARVVEAMELPGILLLPTREGGTWEPHVHDHHGGDENHEGEETHDHEDEEEHEHEGEVGHDHEHDHEGGVDGHLFLDVGNARTVAAAVATALAELDPAHATAYAANAAALDKELQALDVEVAATLAPVAGRPFVVFHDAYQYFERRYNLAALGSITVSPEQSPGAKRLAEIRDRIVELQATCVFAEPGFQPALVETVLSGTGARSGVLDPEGIALDPGPALYGELLRALGQNLRDCLDPN